MGWTSILAVALMHLSVDIVKGECEAPASWHDVWVEYGKYELRCRSQYHLVRGVNISLIVGPLIVYLLAVVVLALTWQKARSAQLAGEELAACLTLASVTAASRRSLIPASTLDIIHASLGNDLALALAKISKPAPPLPAGAPAKAPGPLGPQVAPAPAQLPAKEEVKQEGAPAVPAPASPIVKQ